MNKTVLNLAATFILFLVIGLSAIALIFEPVNIHYEQVDMWGKQNTTATYSPSALSYNGLRLRAGAWLAYPAYNIGLSIIACLALSGAIYQSFELVGAVNTTNDAM